MDGYDDNRQRRALLVGAGLAAAVLLAVGFGAGRASAPTVGPASGAASAGQAGPGPTHVVNGVPVGYAHTQAGAVAAATNFLMVVDGPLVTQPDKYRSAIDTLAAPEAREKQRSDAERLMATMQDGVGLRAYAEHGRTVVFRLAPLAYHVDRYSDREARVSIWAESLIAVDGALSMRETWTTNHLTVAWSQDDWRLSDLGAAGADSFGPVPAVGQTPTQGVALPPQLANYRGYQPAVGA